MTKTYSKRCSSTHGDGLWRRRLHRGFVAVALALAGCQGQAPPPTATGAHHPPLSHPPPFAVQTSSPTTSAPISLASPPVTIPVTPPDLRSGRRVILMARDSIADTPPGVVFQLYLGAVDDAHYLGPLSHYNTTRSSGGSPRDHSFDVTDMARRCSAEGGPWRVMITSTSPPAPGSNPTIRALELVLE
jgi:hypothetical protein